MLFSTLVVETGLYYFLLILASNVRIRVLVSVSRALAGAEKLIRKAKKLIKKPRILSPTLAVETNLKGPFPLRAWKRAFFLSFIDLRLKRAVKIEASAKKKQ